jgi:type III secretion protein HrpB1
MFAKQPELNSAASVPPFMQCGDIAVSALIEIASAGLFQHFPEASVDTIDVELVLDALRTLRPRTVELDTLQGVLHIVNARWEDALRTLREVMVAVPSFGYAQAMYAYCLAACDDASWREYAEQALATDPSPQTAALIRALNVRADLLQARANYRGGQFVLPESYRAAAGEQDDARAESGTPQETFAFPSHAFLRA